MIDNLPCVKKIIMIYNHNQINERVKMAKLTKIFG